MQLSVLIAVINDMAWRIVQHGQSEIHKTLRNNREISVYYGPKIAG